ncbi:GNAT family N-acetyltransferase [Glaciecola sp. KUL10]|uniref:GNAT family N-acetyltransferase n=1 Tax=Glaciecola sp. (strain KUL10) TaxID=2161813 RepID=UPI000D7872B2|nr:GNAT family N-acetyltransferase [Glaciecola sp. KUL10]GBL06153.1 GCN5-related N-acetyltransferase [Glaciecola sp. KUL10]
MEVKFNGEKYALITPEKTYEDSFNNYIKELGSEERYPYPLDIPADDFQKYVETLHNYSQGKDLPAWLVPNTTYWLICNSEIVACSHLRHELNHQLKHAGGHIGLGVRPSFRGRGLSNLLLDLTIQQARAISIKEIHIHCFEDNLASKQMIQNAGGLLTSRIDNYQANLHLLRYVVS